MKKQMALFVLSFVCISGAHAEDFSMSPLNASASIACPKNDAPEMRQACAIQSYASAGLTFAPTLTPFFTSQAISEKDHKMILEAKDDATAFVATNGEWRGAYLEAAIQNLRAKNPAVEASDLEIAIGIISY